MFKQLPHRRPRVKLITLPWELEVPTLALASIAAVTPPQFDIAIVDLLREHLFFDEEVDLVGITASTPQIDAAYALADLYRARGVTVVIGGHHVTALPQEGLAHADAVVLGEGETSWRRICEQWLTNPSSVGGVYKDPAPDPGTLPQPRVDLMKIERYGAFYYPIVGSRGCPEACSFCFAKRMTLGYRTYPIAHVLEQIRRRPKWVRSLYFVDDNLAGDPEWTKELFTALAKDPVPFGMQVRHEFNSVPANLDLAASAGCALISTGYESVNQRTLDRTGKRALKEEYRETIGNVFRAGILPSGNWMFGFDWDGPEIFDETLEFLHSTDLMHSSFTTEIPFPGTQAFKRYRAEGRLLTEDYRRYLGKDSVVVRPLNMTPEQLRSGVRKVALGFHSPAAALRRSRRGLKNPRLAAAWPRWMRAPALLALNGFQVWQWHYRMIDPMVWLYQRLVSVNRYRYLHDFVARTNFRSSDHAPAEAAPRRHESESPFLWRGGHKRSRDAELVPLGTPGIAAPAAADLPAHGSVAAEVGCTEPWP
ncbi:MAG: B12-binding domain-containing radical SAM protein [Archangiaceae bacterium]|nr:B12-binding domain-containing radical SAM protein [Archangiaceae bacterium]